MKDSPTSGVVYRNVGEKFFELKDHLGNVRVVVSDRKNLNTQTNELSANVVAYNNYYPFGMPQPNRNFDNQEYRYGFQGQEKDSELKGEGLSVNYKYRMHDPRVGRFFAVDPLASKYPWNSPYAFSENRLIDRFELEGLESAGSDDKKGSDFMELLGLKLKAMLSIEGRLGVSTPESREYTERAFESGDQTLAQSAIDLQNTLDARLQKSTETAETVAWGVGGAIVIGYGAPLAIYYGGPLLATEGVLLLESGPLWQSTFSSAFTLNSLGTAAGSGTTVFLGSLASNDFDLGRVDYGDVTWATLSSSPLSLALQSYTNVTLDPEIGYFNDMETFSIEMSTNLLGGKGSELLGNKAKPLIDFAGPQGTIFLDILPNSFIEFMENKVGEGLSGDKNTENATKEEKEQKEEQKEEEGGKG